MHLACRSSAQPEREALDERPHPAGGSFAGGRVVRALCFEAASAMAYLEELLRERAGALGQRLTVSHANGKATACRRASIVVAEQWAAHPVTTVISVPRGRRPCNVRCKPL